VWLFELSLQLPVVGLVSHYLTNYLIGRDPLLYRLSFPILIMRSGWSIRY
jgi:hypothetical protein